MNCRAEKRSKVWAEKKSMMLAINNKKSESMRMTLDGWIGRGDTISFVS